MDTKEQALELKKKATHLLASLETDTIHPSELRFFLLDAILYLNTYLTSKG